MISLVGASTSFEEGSELLRSLAGLTIGTKMVERAAEKIGKEIADWEKSTTKPELEKPIPPTLYVGIDGTGVPIRPEELVGRPGKQPDGSARTREVKLCVIWSAEGRNELGIPIRDHGSQTFSAAIESAASNDTNDISSDFARRTIREATRRRFFEAERQVAIADGAPWIWNLFHEHFPKAIQILDLFHAKEHLYDAAKAIWPNREENYHYWLERRETELDSGQINRLIRRLMIHADHCEEARKCANYFLNNKHRMNYQKFRRAGLSVSSGVVEASCKRTIGLRLKRSGMRWTCSGANAIIALRCALLSKRLDTFLEHRISSQRAA